MSILSRNRFSGCSPVVICFAYCLSWLTLSVLMVVCIPARWSASAVSLPAPEIGTLSVTSASPGDSFKITGRNFELAKEKNTVLFTGSISHTPPALALVESVNADGTELSVITPYGAGSGTVSVQISDGQKVESSQTIAVTTSASGDVLDADNSDPVIGARAEFKMGGTVNTAFTSPKGVFMVPVTQGNKREIKIVGSTATPRYGTDRRSDLLVKPDCDNHYIDFMRLHKLNGQNIMVGGGSSPNPHGAGFAGMGMAQAFVSQSKTADMQQEAKGKKPSGQTTEQTNSQSDQPIFKVPPNAKVRFPDGATSGTLNVAIFKPQSAPAPLPIGHYSSSIVQIMPFGVVIEGGAKLSFPNRDGLTFADVAKAKLFRFDQTEGSEKLGTFVEVEGKAGVVTLSKDGKWVETADYAITETSYYFVSIERDTATVTGKVLISNLLERRPIPGAIVISRGQYAYTDVNGEFKLEGVPVIKERGDTAIVETDYLRPDGHVLIRETGGVSLVARQVSKIEQAIVLPPRLINHSPEFTVPNSLTLRVGETRTINLKVVGLDDRNKSSVTVTGAGFATVNYFGILWCKNFKLRLAPQNKDVGDHKLMISAVDSLKVKTSRTVLIKIIPR